MNTSRAGFKEVEHTADWALDVWAPDFPALLEQAAHGMYSLAGMRLQAGPRQVRRFQVNGGEPEDCLVSFLAELLYFTEQESLGFDGYEISGTQEAGLQVAAEGALLAGLEKEIKAVTYHNLKVQGRQGDLRARVVFDV